MMIWQENFNKTVDVLPGYIDKNIDYPKDVASLCKKHELRTIRKPVNLTDKEKKIDTKKIF